jgi:hypothetical protein
MYVYVYVHVYMYIIISPFRIPEFGAAGTQPRRGPDVLPPRERVPMEVTLGPAPRGAQSGDSRPAFQNSLSLLLLLLLLLPLLLLR